MILRKTRLKRLFNLFDELPDSCNSRRRQFMLEQIGICCSKTNIYFTILTVSPANKLSKFVGMASKILREPLSFLVHGTKLEKKFFLSRNGKLRKMRKQLIKLTAPSSFDF